MSLDELFRAVANGSEDAYRLCHLYTTLAHDLDDVVDGDIPRSRVTECIYKLLSLISQPFFREYEAHLMPILFQVVHTWDESNRLMEDGEALGDHLRLNGQEFIICIARIRNDYPTSQKLATELHKLSYNTHHDEKGEPI